MSPSIPPTPHDDAAAATAGPEHVATNDFHLVESPAGWRLTITMSQMLRAALTTDMATGQPAPQPAPATFTMRVEPNLVPGDTFTVTLDVHRFE